MLQKLTFIILLMLPCHHVFGIQILHHITGEGSIPANPSCAQGTIKVIAANYGRTDKTACPGGFSIGGSALNNDKCLLDVTGTLAQACNRKTQCSQGVGNSIFTDPCSGIYKYLNVSYICLTTQEPLDCGGIPCNIIPICQYEKKALTCSGDRKISVYYANYGRTDRLTCPHSNTSLTSDLCFSDQTKTVKLLCKDKVVCKLYVSSLVYLDQCPSLHKYLAVFYACT